MDRRLYTGFTKALQRLLAAAGLALGLAVAPVSAAPLDDAKAAGLIGERPDGYVAAVQPNPSPDIAALVREINRKRRAAYEDIAGKTNTPAAQVGAVTAEKIRAKDPPGTYFLGANGNWVRK